MALDRSKKKTITEIRVTEAGYRVQFKIEMLDSGGVSDKEAETGRTIHFATWDDLPTKAKQFLQGRVN